MSILASHTIGFIGAGNMAEALIRGLVRGGHVPAQRIAASGPRRERLDELAKQYGIDVTTDNRDIARRCSLIVLSTKPQIVDKVLREIGDQLGAELREATGGGGSAGSAGEAGGKAPRGVAGALVVSICAGIATGAIEEQLQPGVRVVRAMPNTPALVGAGATAIAPGQLASETDLATARALFDAVGISVVLDEGQLDAVTGLSGSGPAYIFLILEALADAGVKVGLSRRTAQRLAAQTVMGSAKLLLETDEHPGRLKDMVTSPGGTAIAGLHTLEEGGLRTTLINAVETATKRSRELGRGGK